ncbi:uncharacterized protein LOC101858932 [Aplysia californica]|uniref:Uncharacterized protein LOC101858932 n=1 Tax=Aplysia californica TaxID=6500 RepID=A0ABM0JLP5_APLCA|nr:uncharacterized protein LOC101858932 [Aplysia californica]
MMTWRASPPRPGPSLMVSLLLLGVVISCLLHTCSGESKSACFSPANRTIELDCGEGRMLHIRRTFYGFSPSGQCRLVEEEVGEEGGEGCTLDEHVHYNCVGQQTCSINLPTGQWGLTVPSCGKRSNYFQVEYTCVAASSVSDICRHEQLTSQSGYIMTPNFPSNFHHQGRCTTTVLAHPSQTLRLHIIDMDLQDSSSADCADLLYFNDKLRSITLCGQRNNNSYNMHSNYLHIELQSTSNGRSKGFWLYYEAFPPLPTSLLPPDVKEEGPADDQEGGKSPVDGMQGDASDGQHPESETTQRPYKHPKSTVPLYRSSGHKSKPLPFAAIAGGVIGTLSLVLIVLLLLLLIKWYRERRYNKVEKVLEIRNPAFRSSTDFHEAHTQHQQASLPNNNSGYYC